MRTNDDVMYVAGMLSDCQELLGPDLNDEDGWISPDNAKQVVEIMNNAKRMMFSKTFAGDRRTVVSAQMTFFSPESLAFLGWMYGWVAVIGIPLIVVAWWDER